MNYYKITKIPRNKYITSYEIKNDIIILKLANNEKYVVKNTIDNENKILERMDKQVNLITKNKFNNRLINYLVVYLIGSALSLVLIFKSISLIVMLINTSFSITTILLATFNLVLALCIFNGIRLFNKEDKDLKKIKLYCEAKELLNNNIKSSSINVLNKVSNKTNKQVRFNLLYDEPFTINSINKMSLKDLEILKSNIEREEEFGFEQDQPLYKTKTKRKN